MISVLLLSCNTREKYLDNVFYVFNNGVRTLPNAPGDYDSQAALVKRLGYDGISGHISQLNSELKAALDKHELRMPEVYFGLTITNEGQVEYDKAIDELVKICKDQDLLVAFFTNADKYSWKQMEGDKILAEFLKEYADFAQEYGAKVAVYPHVNNYCETIDHCIKIAQLVDRSNMGVIYNTCHLFKVEGDDDWRKKAEQALPYLFMVSINGIDSGDTQNMGWDRLIRPLGEGSFDTYELVKFFKDKGFAGPFGLQCYGITEDCEIALAKSIKTWRSYQERYSQE